MTSAFLKQQTGSGTEALCADFVILDTARIEGVTMSLRRSIDMVMMGSAHEETLRQAMLSLVAITYHDDIAVLIEAESEGSDASVRFIDFEYIADGSPEDVLTIAASPDEYIAKCLGHLTKTLNTEIYWW